MSTLVIFLLFACSFQYAAGACTFPSDIRGTWVSSNSGSLTFNSSHMVDYPVYNQGNLAFSCHTLTGNYYILLSEEFTLFSSPAIAVMCFTFTNIKTSLYQYQIHTNMLQDAEYQRIRFAATGTTVDSSLACTDLGSTDYYLLMADGQISAVKQQCPDVFLATLSFSFNESDCANNTGSLDVCSDLNTMSFNYSDCSTVQAYSTGGSLNCLYSTTSGDVTTLNVYNLDATTDEQTTYRFTCYMIEQTSGSSNIYATQYPQSCHINQTSTYVPGPGANLTLVPTVTCIPSTTTEATTVSQASLIAGLAAGFIVLLLLLLLIICFYCYKKKSKVQPAGKAPIDTDPGELHPDTTCAESAKCTTEPVELEQDTSAILHDTDLDIPVNKQQKSTVDANISVNGNRDNSNAQVLKRRDRQAPVRFTVSNLKKNQVNRRAKTEPKAKPSPKPSVPKKRLPWPALFLNPEEDKRKVKERGKNEKLSTGPSKNSLVTVSQDTNIEKLEESMTKAEQIISHDVLQKDEDTSKQTALTEEDRMDLKLKENEQFSPDSTNSPHVTSSVEYEKQSSGTVLESVGDAVKYVKELYPIDVLQQDTISETEQTDRIRNEMKLRENKDLSNESQNSMKEEQTVLEYETTRVNDLCKNEINNEKDEGISDGNLTESEDANVPKTLIKDDRTQHEHTNVLKTLSEDDRTQHGDANVLKTLSEDERAQHEDANVLKTLIKDDRTQHEHTNVLKTLSEDDRTQHGDANVLKTLSEDERAQHEDADVLKTLIKDDRTQHEHTNVLKTLIKDKSETTSEMVQERNDILTGNSTAADFTRNESATDSGVYSNSSSVEPNTVLLSHVADISYNKKDNIQIYSAADTLQIDETDLAPSKQKTTNDVISKAEQDEQCSVLSSACNKNDTQKISVKKSPVCGQSVEKKDPILNTIDHEKNVYVDMLKDLTSDESNSRTPRMKPVLIDQNPMSDDIQKEDIVTARHVTLTQEEDITQEDRFSGKRMTDKAMSLERERTHYSIEKTPLPSIGKQDYIEKSNKKERMRHIKEKRLHNKKHKKDKGNRMDQREHQPTEILHSTEPLPTEPSDIPQSYDKSDDETLPKLVRPPHKIHDDTMDKHLPVINTEAAETLTNHERKTGEKNKKKKFSFLPTITNASMFANEFTNTDGEILPNVTDSSEIINDLPLPVEPKAEENIKLETLKEVQPSKEADDQKPEPEVAPTFKLPDPVTKTKSTKMKKVNHKPKGLTLPNLTGQTRHSAPEFRLPIVSSDNKEKSRRPDSFKEATNTQIVPLVANRALVLGSSEDAWVEKESTNKSKKGRKHTDKVTGKESQKSKKAAKISERPKRKRRRKRRIEAAEDEDDVDTSKYFDDKKRAGKVRPGDKDDLQGLIMRIRENTITDFGFQNNDGSESSEYD